MRRTLPVRRIAVAAVVAANFLLDATTCATEPPATPSNHLAGRIFDYVVQPGDYLIKIGARFGMAASLIAESNNIPYDAILVPGRSLRLDNRHIVPQQMTRGILINIPQRMFFYFDAGTLSLHYPVGLGRPDWPTPVGDFTVRSLQVDKVWNVPKSIQEEMLRKRKAVSSCVPPGPENPLGKHWIGLSISGIGIHSTIAPASVFHFQSHGCIRLHADDAAAIFPLISVGTPGRLIYEPVLLTRLDDGRIFVEVHRDVYNRRPDPRRTLEREAHIKSIADLIDWEKAGEAIRRKTGLAVEIGKAADGKTVH